MNVKSISEQDGATDQTGPLILEINGKRFAPKGADVAGVYGHYESRRNGVLLSDVKNEPFVFIVGNRWQEYFFVSCSIHEGRLWYMHSTSTLDDTRLGFDKMGYGAKIELAEQFVTQVRQGNAVVPAKPAVELAAA